MKKHGSWYFIVIMILGLWSGGVHGQPKNVILFIGDGMGPEQITAGRMLAGEPLSFESLESFPNQGKVTTYAADDPITDSAAAGTAIATGQKVNNGVISIAAPGDGGELETVLERSQAQGKSVGLVTTVYITHATPAVFGAHEASRANYADIGIDYLLQTRPNLLFGGAYVLAGLGAAAEGYTVIESVTALEALDTEALDPDSADFLFSGQFGTASTGLPYEYETGGDFGDLPHLSQMTAKALQILDNDSDGFFLMVEGGKIDKAGHANDIDNLAYEVVEFANAVDEAIAWAQGRDDTLIIVTADHETGGMTVVTDNGSNNVPTVEWGTTGHSSADVDIFATGPNSEFIAGTIDNTDIHAIMTMDPNAAANPVPLDGGAGEGLDAHLSWTVGASVASSDLYFGMNLNAVANADTTSAEFMGNTTTLSFDPGALDLGAVYYWCVDTRDTDGTLLSIGEVWSFTTLLESFIQAGVDWKYEDSGTDLGTTWKNPGFDDSTWASGPAQLGFGDGDEVTLLASGPDGDRNPTTYLRHSFLLNDPSSIFALNLELLRDDGAVVYLNGVEIVRDNLPTGEISYTTLASSAVGGDDESAWFQFTVDPSALVAGANVVAVELHQINATSSDLSFDLSLQPIDAPVDDPPAAPTGLTAEAGSDSITLDWNDNSEEDLAGYTVWKGAEPYVYSVSTPLLVTSSTYTDSDVEQGSTYYYAVTAVDDANQDSPYSTGVSASPPAPSADAYVSQDPSITYGILSGSGIAGLREANDGLLQTIEEGASGRAGASSLLAEYTLTTQASPAEITSLELVVSLSWNDADANDALHVEIRKTDSSWEDITSAALAGSWTPSVPTAYVDGSGNMVVRFTDSAAVKKEKKGVLTLDQLFAKVEAGPIAPDTTAPVLSNVQAANVDHDSASITWNSDESSDSVVLYGMDTDLDSGIAEAAMTTSHSIVLDGLKAETTYYYSVSSKDDAGNVSAPSATRSFTTLAADTTAPILYNVAAAIVDHASASITWDSDESSDSVVQYGLDASLGSTITEAALTTNHSVALSGLQAETTYYYSVSSKDAAGNVSAAAAIQSFTTPAAPTLQTIRVSSLDIEIVVAKKVSATVTAVVKDAQGQPVIGATVSGDWYFKGVLVASESETTDAMGTISNSSPAKPAKTGNEFRFVVTGVSMTNGDYDADGSVTEASALVP